MEGYREIRPAPPAGNAAALQPYTFAYNHPTFRPAPSPTATRRATKQPRAQARPNVVRAPSQSMPNTPQHARTLRAATLSPLSHQSNSDIIKSGLARRPGTSVLVRYDQTRRSFCINVLPIVAWAELLAAGHKTGRAIETSVIPSDDHPGWPAAVERAVSRISRYAHLSVLRSVYCIPLANGLSSNIDICDCLDVSAFAQLLEDCQRESATLQYVWSVLALNCFGVVRARLVEMNSFFSLLASSLPSHKHNSASKEMVLASQACALNADQQRAGALEKSVKSFINKAYSYGRSNCNAPAWAVPLVETIPETRMISIDHAYTQYCEWLRNAKSMPLDAPALRAAKTLGRVTAGEFCAAMMKGYAHRAQYHITLDEHRHYLIGERPSASAAQEQETSLPPPGLPLPTATFAKPAAGSSLSHGHCSTGASGARARAPSAAIADQANAQVTHDAPISNNGSLLAAESEAMPPMADALPVGDNTATFSAGSQQECESSCLAQMAAVTVANVTQCVALGHSPCEPASETSGVVNVEQAQQQRERHMEELYNLLAPTSIDMAHKQPSLDRLGAENDPAAKDPLPQAVSLALQIPDKGQDAKATCDGQAPSTSVDTCSMDLTTVTTTETTATQARRNQQRQIARQPIYNS